MDTKANGYLAAGTRLVWVVEPAQPDRDGVSPRSVTEELALEGYLDGYDVLPGFRVAVAAIFDV